MLGLKDLLPAILTSCKFHRLEGKQKDCDLVQAATDRCEPTFGRVQKRRLPYRLDDRLFHLRDSRLVKVVTERKVTRYTLFGRYDPRSLVQQKSDLFHTFYSVFPPRLAEKTRT